MSTDVAPAKTIDLKPETELEKAARHVRSEHQAMSGAVKDVVVRAMNLGDVLKQKKVALGHGRFIVWVETECDIDRRMAQRYMKLAEARPVIEKYMAKSDIMSSLTLTGALRLIAKDKKAGPTATVAYDNAEKRLIEKLERLPDDQRNVYVQATITTLRTKLGKTAG